MLLLHACLAAYILHLFLYSYFWHCHPYILQHFNRNVFTLLSHWFFLYVSIKANNSIVQEFCAVLILGLYGRAIPTYTQRVYSCRRRRRIEKREKCEEGRTKTLPKKTQHFLGDSEKKPNRTESNTYHKTQIKMAYNREEVPWAWLTVVLSKDFLVKGTTPAKKKPICAERKINT